MRDIGLPLLTAASMLAAAAMLASGAGRTAGAAVRAVPGRTADSGFDAPSVSDRSSSGGDDFFDRVLRPSDVAEPWVSTAATAAFGQAPGTDVPAPTAPPAGVAPQYAPACDPARPFAAPVEPWAGPAAGTGAGAGMDASAIAAAGDPGLLAGQQRTAAYLGEAGYIDLAVPFTNLRLRYDAAYDSNFMTRAEFTNATCGTPGAPLPETNYDAQYVALYYEQLVTPRFSVFAEMPFLMLDPEVNANASGLYDMNFGAKYALVAEPDEYFTFQMRVYTPTGDTSRGLSTGHASLEPGLLYTRRFTSRLTLLSELRYWIPIDGSTQLGNQDAAGNVLRYGVGLGYAVVDNADLRVAPIAELVGWHVFDGLKFNANTGFLPADNDAIVNFKIGVRVTNFDATIGNTSSLYVGYGTALTDERWYQDLFRVEYRISF